MKHRYPLLTLGAVAALMLACTLATRGADLSAASSAEQSGSPSAQSATETATPKKASSLAPSATPAPSAAAAPSAASASTSAAPVSAVESPKPGLRRIDRTADETARDGHDNLRDTIRDSVRRHIRPHHVEGTENERVSILHDVMVAEDEKATQAVAIVGDTTVDGEATDQAVSVWGSTTVNGLVGDQAVSVLGNTTVNGSVGGQAVAVGGNMTVNGHVGGEVVCVGGDLRLGPDAEVDGEVVVVGGEMKKDPSAILHGQVQQVHLPVLRPAFAWVTSALLKGRLLSFEPRAAWAWLIAAAFLGIYVLLALVFPRGMMKCVETLEQRPGHVILTALLTMLAMPLVFLLLAITGVGMLVIPFLAIGLLAAKLFGRAAMLTWFGRRFTGLFGEGFWSSIAMSVLCGGIIVGLLYTVPILALIVAMLVGVLGLGTVIYTLILTTRKNGHKPAPVGPAVPPAGAEPGAKTIEPPFPLAFWNPVEPLPALRIIELPLPP